MQKSLSKIFRFKRPNSPGVVTALSFFLLVATASGFGQQAAKQPTWYVFKIKEIRKVTHSPDKTFSTMEAVTVKDKPFTVKLVWTQLTSGVRTLDAWVNTPKAKFAENVPYVIAGTVLSLKPLTISPDTLAPKAPNFGAPEENVF